MGYDPYDPYEYEERQRRQKWRREHPLKWVVCTGCGEKFETREATECQKCWISRGNRQEAEHRAELRKNMVPGSTTKAKCPICKGSGTYLFTSGMSNRSYYKPCQHCGGEGWVWLHPRYAPY